MTVLVARDRADAAAIGRGLAREHVAQRLLRLRRDERAFLHGVEPDLVREVERAGPGHHDLLAALEHRARDDHRRREVRRRRDRARAPLRSVHHGRAGLDGAIARERGAEARAELGIVLELPDRRDYRVERSGAALEQRVAGRRRRAQTLAYALHPIGRYGPHTTVYEDHGIHRTPVRQSFGAGPQSTPVAEPL